MEPYLTLAIVLLVLLVVLFVVTYVLNKRTPVPKGCEKLDITDEFCMQCNQKACRIHEKLMLEKIKEDLAQTQKEES